MSKTLQGIAFGIFVLTLVIGTPPAYALFGKIKKMGTAFKNGATNSASSVNHAAKRTASSAVKVAQKADQQAKPMVGQVADVFEKI
jgi:hypothetical protein